MRYARAEARRTEIVRLAARSGYVASADLSVVLGVSEMTVRRDIEKLAAGGSLERVPGGAMFREGARPTFGVRATHASHAKRAIARKTASLLPIGTIGLDSGTTVALVAPLVGAGSCIVTQSAPVIETIEARGDLDLIVPGGVYQRSTRSFVGPSALCALEGLALDVAVLSVAGVDDGWLLGADALDAAVKRALISASRRIIVAVDGSKVGVRAPIRLAPLAEVDDLVTDARGADALDFLAPPCRVVRAEEALVK